MAANLGLKLKQLWRHSSVFIMTKLFWMACVINLSCASLWENWWSYDSISGPNYWHINPEWRMCNHGRQQSPINIQPSKLLFDPNLKHLKVEANVVNGELKSGRHQLLVEVKSPRYKWINITQGPLSYKYRVSAISFHLANKDTHGSEHQIDGKAFPVEMHIIAFNSDLYANLTEARTGVKGIAIISVFIDVGKEIHKSFYRISKELQWLKRRRTVKTTVSHISIKHLLPKTKEYMTYEGSLTEPPCLETVTWIVMNKPLFIAKDQLAALRAIRNGTENETTDVGRPLEMNSRPVMPLNNRVVRTNINLARKHRPCTMERNMSYEVNTRYSRPTVPKAESLMPLV